MMIYINISILPIAICSIFSVHVAEFIGYTKLIKICGIIYPLGIILSS